MLFSFKTALGACGIQISNHHKLRDESALLISVEDEKAIGSRAETKENKNDDDFF